MKRRDPVGLVLAVVGFYVARIVIARRRADIGAREKQRDQE